MPLERWLNRQGALVMPLALLVVLLLFLQWPLRDGWGTGSSQANDLAQVLFALYVAVALRHADRRGAHLVSRPDLKHAGRAAVGDVCVHQRRPHGVAVGAGLESFPETANPGYFAIKLALLLLALQALAELWRGVHTLRTPTGTPADPA